MAIDLTQTLKALDETKSALADLAYRLDVASGDLDAESAEDIKAVLQDHYGDARLLVARLALAIASVASLAEPSKPDLFAINDGYGSLKGYNMTMAGKVHALAGSTSALMANTLRGRGFCACDTRDTCAAHAEAWNQMQEAEQHLTKAARAFVNAGK